MAEQNRGSQARKIELEHRLDANADAEHRRFAVRTDGVAREEQAGALTPQPTPQQHGGGRGHKAQQAAPHRSGRPGGGNIRNEAEE